MASASQIDFRILGPLEVSLAGQPLALAGARQRGLLALLLLHANQVVSSDGLIEDLWGDDPPDSGTAALQVRVSQLRKTLGPVGERLQTRAPGYLIRVEPGELDLHRFERLCERAEDAEPAEAAGMLREALDLWVGMPLADFAYERFAQRAIGRLEEVRLAALERRIDAELALGRHAALVPELQDLCAKHRLHERFHARLMLALYASGRQADALDVYQSVRRALVDELGIEPGPTLREVQQAILRQDASLPGAAATPDRSLLVASATAAGLPRLIALASPLARRPRREIVVALLVDEAVGLSDAAAAVDAERTRLLADGQPARGAAFTSTSPGRDAARMAVELDADLLLVDAPPRLLDDPELVALLEAAPCDVAVVLSDPHPGPVLVPFTGAESDWSAVELGAWLARAWEAPLRLAGPAHGAGGDASRLLASASLVVQRALGVAAAPLLVDPGPDELIAAAAQAGTVVAGLSDRWPKHGLGETRSALAASGRPVALVRRGLRPGGLAPREGRTRFTWSLARG